MLFKFSNTTNPFYSYSFLSRAEIINSVRKISAIGEFNPEKNSPTIIPSPEKITNGFVEVNIVFELTENIKKIKHHGGINKS